LGMTGSEGGGIGQRRGDKVRRGGIEKSRGQ